MSLVFKTFAASDLGLQREGNEDSGLITSKLVAVADGMGGHAGGEVASTIAIKALAKLATILDDPALDKESREELLLNISFEIDGEISAKSKAEPALSGMGTTLTALHLNGDVVELLHIGDSRCYLFSEKKLTQISYDHTVMQELLDQGRLTADEVINHPQRSLLTQALMGDSGIDPELLIHPVKAGDKFLLCSDGLTGVLSDLEIQNIIKSNEGIEAISELIKQTLTRGAPDNVTVILAEVVDGESDKSFDLLGAANE